MRRNLAHTRQRRDLLGPAPGSGACRKTGGTSITGPDIRFQTGGDIGPRRDGIRKSHRGTAPGTDVCGKICGNSAACGHGRIRGSESPGSGPGACRRPRRDRARGFSDAAAGTAPANCLSTGSSGGAGPAFACGSGETALFPLSLTPGPAPRGCTCASPGTGAPLSGARAGAAQGHVHPEL